MGHVRPGIVHRLDRGTSGLLVVAKDEPTREALKDRFARHAIEREYAAIVAGEARDATYDTLHGRHPTDRLRFTSWIRGGAGAPSSGAGAPGSRVAMPRRAVTPNQRFVEAITRLQVEVTQRTKVGSTDA